MADDIYVTVETQQIAEVSAVGIQGLSSTSNNLESISNIDATLLENGSVLVYKTATQKWTSTLTLEDQLMNGGHF